MISRRIRDAGVFAEVVPSNISAAKIAKDKDVKGIILSGGSRSVYEKNAPKFDKKVLNLNIPILGICYGHQLIAHLLGGRVASGKSGEYGPTPLNQANPKFNFGYTGLSQEQGKSLSLALEPLSSVWMNHRDAVTDLPKGFVLLASTAHSKIAAYGHPGKKIFGVQFHPEVSHTQNGQKILENFVFGICNCKKSRSSKSIMENIIEEARGTIGDSRAIIGLSGGIDSATAALLVARAIKRNLTAVYVDTGLMREGETDFIRKMFGNKNIGLEIVNAQNLFFKKLRGIVSPERKRKIIGKLFADIFYKIAKNKKAAFLVQGTIYSDRIESGVTKHSSKIKSHHNVGGLPKNLGLNLYEPLRDLYKDEVRAIGKTLKIPKEITTQQVFPGPGLGIRIIGEVTPRRVKIVRAASYIIEGELKKTVFWKDIWMSFAVLLPIKSVGIQGDKRTYKYPVVVRIIESKDAMTANFSKISYDVLERISTRVTNEVKEVNRVVYDITNKPPGTMEWE